MIANQYMKSPWPQFGGKSAVADLVWSRLGDVDNYIEPFLGSGAVAIARPHPPRIECYGDWNCFISGVFRAIVAVPDEVAYWAGAAPVAENDLHATHRWLMGVAEPEPLVPPRYDRHPLLREAYLAGYARQDGSYGRAYRRRMRTDPDYYDPKISGRWVFGACAWIGSGWCEEDPAEVAALVAGEDIKTPGSAEWEQIPHLHKAGSQGMGIHLAASHRNFPDGQLPHLAGGDGGPNRGIHSNIPTEKRPQLHTGNSEHGRGVHGKAVTNQIPMLVKPGGGIGVHVRTAGRPQLADAYSRGRGVHGNDDAGTCQQRHEWLCRWFGVLADRFRTSRFCCGDWTETIEAWRRICNSPSTTTRLGTVGLFIDPPYREKRSDGSPSRAAGLYGRADRHEIVGKLNDDVLAYCLAHGGDPQFRICVASYFNDGYDVLVEQYGWDIVAWRSRGGYSNRSGSNKNRDRERLYFSPHCLKPNVGRPKQASLFGDDS